MRRSTTRMLAAATLVAVGACSNSGPSDYDVLTSADRGFVGEVAGTDAFVAVVEGAGRVVGYVCDGDVDLAEWFSGDLDSSGQLDLTNDDGAELVATIDDGALNGTFTSPQTGARDVRAEKARGDAGLYRLAGDDARAAGIVAGWIVANDGTQRGSLRVGGVARTAPAMPGASLVVDGNTLAVSVYVAVPPDVSVTPPRPATPPGVPIPYPNVAKAG